MRGETLFVPSPRTPAAAATRGARPRATHADHPLHAQTPRAPPPPLTRLPPPPPDLPHHSSGNRASAPAASVKSLATFLRR